MQPFATVSGPAIPLMLPNVDTDVIIRIDRLTAAQPGGLGPYAFEALRYRPGGEPDPDCVLNAPAFKDAPILLAGPNFGCGSSREPAVRALMAMGVRCVIAESFGDIFYANSFQNGLLPVRLAADEVKALAAECAGGGAAAIDLGRQQVIAPSGRVFAFDIDPLRRSALLEGLDDIGLTLKSAAAVEAWQARDRQARPWVWKVEAA
jgi:3-isopropylmalate/(R)-2-methylmalate dehydratase small subunit